MSGFHLYVRWHNHSHAPCASKSFFNLWRVCFTSGVDSGGTTWDRPTWKETCECKASSNQGTTSSCRISIPEGVGEGRVPSPGWSRAVLESSHLRLKLSAFEQQLGSSLTTDSDLGSLLNSCSRLLAFLFELPSFSIAMAHRYNFHNQLLSHRIGNPKPTCVLSFYCSL